ncbi:hypothetical protein [Zobellia uliginosa]|uniref:hypothetical protein n=1 Tax=Zobellia uliginosa TaxID=143224 RepID=UPI001C06C476|nr:hypothetical protein [Zobellia uliginosa]MBU2946287.1 hypothetical protein [Zobellia uliginosa]
MILLNKILDNLDLDENLIRLINQEIKIPYLDDYNHIEGYWYPHPPCLIPFFTGFGASYKGVIRHFFFEREMSYVEFELENGYMSEVSRTIDQFFTRMVIDMDMIEEGLSPKILSFCKEINIKNAKEIDAFCEEYGNNPRDYINLPVFAQKTPLRYALTIDTYDGQYPSSPKLLNKNYIKDACSYEIATKEVIETIFEAPSWLNFKNEKFTLFNKYISEDKLKEAWLTLNSNNWILNDVAEGLEILKSKTKDKLFHLVADNWIEGMEKANKGKESY